MHAQNMKACLVDKLFIVNDNWVSNYFHYCTRSIINYNLHVMHAEGSAANTAIIPHAAADQQII